MRSSCLSQAQTDVAQDGSCSRSKHLLLPRRSRWSISRTLLRNRPSDLVCLGIDIPIGLLDGSRACDKGARTLLKRPRGSSVFPAPCRAALHAETYKEASAVNRQRTGRGLSQQAWGIAPKIKQVDDAITPECQQWAFEVHPEVCFWALNQTPPNEAQQEDKRGSRRKDRRSAPNLPRD